MKFIKFGLVSSIKNHSNFCVHNLIGIKTMKFMFQVAGCLDYANFIYADFPITKTSTRRVEIRSEEESFCIHCVLDIFQSDYMCLKKLNNNIG